MKIAEWAPATEAVLNAPAGSQVPGRRTQKEYHVKKGSIAMKTIPLKQYNMLWANFGLLSHVLADNPSLIEWLREEYPNEFRKADIE